MHNIIKIKKYSQLGNTPTWQINVTGNDATVVCRVRVMSSSFDFLWSSRTISKEAQQYICDWMAHEFWG